MIDLTEEEGQGKTCFLVDEKGEAHEDGTQVKQFEERVTVFEGGVMHYGERNGGTKTRVSIMVTLSTEDEDENDGIRSA